MTSSGVERDLNVTPYVSVINYYGDNKHSIAYAFSSKATQTKFEEEIYANREFINYSLHSRFRIKFHVGDDLCDLNLYRKLERRGFLIKLDGDEITWLGQVEYNGRQVCKVS